MTERIILRRPVTAREYTAFENRASAAGVEKVGMIENTIMLSSIVPGFFILPKGTDATENEWGGGWGEYTEKLHLTSQLSVSRNVQSIRSF